MRASPSLGNDGAIRLDLFVPKLQAYLASIHGRIATTCVLAWQGIEEILSRDSARHHCQRHHGAENLFHASTDSVGMGHNWCTTLQAMGESLP